MPVRARTEMAMISMLYKIKNEIAPNYLYDILPKDNAANVTHRLRSSDNIRMPFTRCESFRRSFFPTAIRLWNKLDQNVRNSPTLNMLKISLKKKSPDKPTLYYYGKRWASVHHSRLRMECSKLNFDLCYRLYVSDSPACRCGALRETAEHFFMECPLFTNIRDNLFTAVSRHTACTTQILLYGDTNLSDIVNFSIFDAVHDYITESNRFV